MQPADDKLTAALAAGSRVTAHESRCGGRDLTDQVQSWSLERSYATDLPDAMRAFSGSAAAQLTLETGGTGGVSAPALYSPWAKRATGDVVRPGQSVVHRAGLDAGLLPAFRGRVRTRAAASGTDTVSVTALDGSERLQGRAVLPRPDVGFRTNRPVATAAWCVDELMRQAGLHSCPPPRAPEFTTVDKPLSVFYASLHGGFAATYGTPLEFPDASDYTWIREGAPHSMALRPAATGLKAVWAPRSRIIVPGTKLYVEAWVNVAEAAGNNFEIRLQLDRKGSGLGYLSCKVDFAAGKMSVYSGTEGGAGHGLVWTIDELRDPLLRSVWHLGFWIDTGASGAAKARPTAQVVVTDHWGRHLVRPVGTITEATADQTPAELYKVQLITDMATEAVQITSDVDAMPADAAIDQQGQWTRAVELDDATLPLVSIPRVSGSQWEAVTEIAKAALATAEFDERGIFKWRNHLRFRNTPTKADLTLTTTREISSLTISEEIDACRNHVEIPYKDWSKVGTVQSDTLAGSVVTVPKSSTVTNHYAIAEEEYDILPPVTDDDEVIMEETAIRFSKSKSSGNKAEKGAVEVEARRVGGVLSVRMSNRLTVPLYTCLANGTSSSLYLKTTRPAKDPVERRATSRDTVSQAHYGVQQYIAEASEWIQDKAAAESLATTLVRAGRYPVPLIGDVEVLYDPRVQLGDVVRLKDSSGAELDTLCWVIGIKASGGAGGAVQQTLTLRGTSYNGVPVDSGLTPDPPVG
ncbi:hypothetical protein [Streptomyces silvensis]|uniref:Uncharacterized protein n=1 Tax=Streptomyces silvensis TaxID=1765722 RepID=A0A0W7X3X3_9ACTN|nr:hypothetical protein [Streptomyces silvensis]KUF17533.1 hypothetical protein AT728_08885 [Streptomyces silvensis]